MRNGLESQSFECVEFVQKKKVQGFPSKEPPLKHSVLWVLLPTKICVSSQIQLWVELSWVKFESFESCSPAKKKLQWKMTCAHTRVTGTRMTRVFAHTLYLLSQVTSHNSQVTGVTSHKWQLTNQARQFPGIQNWVLRHNFLQKIQFFD
jgi:hypothetical protein